MQTRVVSSAIHLLAVLLAGVLAPGSAWASFLPPEMMDKAADILAIVVLCIVPIGAIALMLMTSGSGLLWAGSRRRRQDGSEDED